MDYDVFLKIVQNTRSIRRFKTDPVPDESVDKIIEAARWAPSGFNEQPWEFVVVKKPELRKKIYEFCTTSDLEIKAMEKARAPWQGVWNSPPAGSGGGYGMAPVYILLYGDTRTIEGLPMAVQCDKTHCLEVFTSTLANAFVYMHIAAATLGLGSQWVSVVNTPYAQCLIKDLLGIRKELEIHDMLALGYPDMQPRPKLMRDKDRMVHFDYCGPEAFRTDEEVREYIRQAIIFQSVPKAKKAES
jgi:nitroreductase